MHIVLSFHYKSEITKTSYLGKKEACSGLRFWRSVDLSEWTPLVCPSGETRKRQWQCAESNNMVGQEVGSVMTINPEENARELKGRPGLFRE